MYDIGCPSSRYTNTTFTLQRDIALCKACRPVDSNHETLQLSSKLSLTISVHLSRAFFLNKEMFPWKVNKITVERLLEHPVHALKLCGFCDMNFDTAVLL